jgi:predicted cobalt transporter CbtA
VSLLPTYDEVPAGYPASLLFRFRMASLLTQVTLWVVLGVALAELLSRLVGRTAAGSRPATPLVGWGA